MNPVDVCSKLTALSKAPHIPSDTKSNRKIKHQIAIYWLSGHCSALPMLKIQSKSCTSSQPLDPGAKHNLPGLFHCHPEGQMTFLHLLHPKPKMRDFVEFSRSVCALIDLRIISGLRRL